MTLLEEIGKGESVGLEFKEARPKDSLKFTKTVVAFANGRGGRVLFGVENGSGRIVGIPRAKVAAEMDAIVDAIRNTCTPAVSIDVKPAVVNGASLIAVDVRGGGVSRYFTACADKGLPAPDVAEEAGFFKIVFYRAPKGRSVGDCVNERVNERVGERVDERVNEGANMGPDALLSLIAKHPGRRTQQLAVAAGKSVQTVSRYVRLLKDRGQIEFRGAPKTGGYYRIGDESGEGGEEAGDR